MSRRRIAAAGILAVALFAAAGIGVFRSIGSGAGPSPEPAPDQSALLVPAAGTLDASIASLQDRLRAVPADWEASATLGLAYVQQARITADPTYYPKAYGILRASLHTHPHANEGALVGLAALASARHDFSTALRFGERARTINPYDADVYGVIGDALVELGRYRNAFASFQTMVDTRPGLASYARVSYARELQGDVAGAMRSMRVARDVAGTPSDAAWASFQLGELRFNSGRLAAAAQAYRVGTKLDPNFVPSFAGLAKVAWARGDTNGAVAGYTEVVNRYPAPEYVIALGDLYASRGDAGLAARQYDLVRAEAKLFRANGVNTDLELALFDADHGKPRAALRSARAEWGRRHSINVADAVGWALYANGRYEAAAVFAGRALALGTRSAIFLYHAGMIQLHLGHDSAARTLLRRAIRTNPTFSILGAPLAATTLAGLEGAP